MENPPGKTTDFPLLPGFGIDNLLKEVILKVSTNVFVSQTGEGIPMKRKILVILQICVLLLTLTACQPEKKAVEAINAIGNVTLGSLEIIEYAESLYNALDVPDRVKVTNKNTLDRARTEYNRQDAVVKEAEQLVSAIGEVTLTSGKTIEKAREAFDAAIEYDVVGRLTGAEKTLKTAEEKFAALQQETEELLTKAEELCSKGKYREAEQLIADVIDEYRELEIAEPYGTLAVEALCEYSQKEYNSNNFANAMDAIMKAMDYEDCCEPSTYARISKQISNYANGMNKFKPDHEEVIDRTYNPGRNRLHVTAGNYDTLVKVELLDNPNKYIKVFVEANKTATIYMQNGEYRVKYTCGPLWIDEYNMFGDFASFIEFPETITMAGFTVTENKVTTQRWNVYKATLTTGYEKDFGYQNFDPEMF